LALKFAVVIPRTVKSSGPCCDPGAPLPPTMSTP
jgi:hypothetical protein